jgi:hypothetical protein
LGDQGRIGVLGEEKGSLDLFATEAIAPRPLTISSYCSRGTLALPLMPMWSNQVQKIGNLPGG